MSILIIGSGLAGYNFVKAFRQQDTATPITVITQDAGDFYPKPQLSTAIRLKKSPQDLITMNAAKMAETYDITVLTETTVTAIDTASKTIQYADTYLAYDHLILATGAITPMPYFSGNATDHVLQVNDLYQYETFRQVIEGKRHITILGAGLVGVEFANDLLQGGHEVTLIDPAHTALNQLAPKAVGQALVNRLTEHGANWHLGHVAKAIDYQDERFTLTLDNDELLTADIVLSAIGLKPNIALAQQSGITVDQGIVVDHTLKTSADGVYALGDCIQLEGFGFLPYIAPMLQCVQALVQTLTNTPTKVQYPAMPVSVKTNLYPICVCYPRRCGEGCWEITETPEGIRGLYHDQSGTLHGYVLTDGLVKERMALTKTVADWI